MMKNMKTILTVKIIIEKRTINNVNGKNKWQLWGGKVVKTEEVTSAKANNEFWTSIISCGIATRCFK